MAEWKISATQAKRYKSLFHRLIDRQNKKAPSRLSNSDKGPLLKGSTAVTFFTQSGLSREVLSSIWNLTDHDDVGSLHEGKFTAALHMSMCVSRKKLAVPASLPANLAALIAQWDPEVPSSTKSSDAKATSAAAAPATKSPLENEFQWQPDVKLFYHARFKLYYNGETKLYSRSPEGPFCSFDPRTKQLIPAASKTELTLQPAPCMRRRFRVAKWTRKSLHSYGASDKVEYYYLNNMTQETTSVEPSEGFSIPGQEETYEGFAIDSATPLMDALERIGLFSAEAELSRNKMKTEGSVEHEVDCYKRLQSLVYLLKDSKRSASEWLSVVAKASPSSKCLGDDIVELACLYLGPMTSADVRVMVVRVVACISLLADTYGREFDHDDDEEEEEEEEEDEDEESAEEDEADDRAVDRVLPEALHLVRGDVLRTVVTSVPYSVLWQHVTQGLSEAQQTSEARSDLGMDYQAQMQWLCLVRSLICGLSIGASRDDAPKLSDADIPHQSLFDACAATMQNPRVRAFAADTMLHLICTFQSGLITLNKPCAAHDNPSLALRAVYQPVTSKGQNYFRLFSSAVLAALSDQHYTGTDRNDDHMTIKLLQICCILCKSTATGHALAATNRNTLMDILTLDIRNNPVTSNILPWYLRAAHTLVFRSQQSERKTWTAHNCTAPRNLLHACDNLLEADDLPSRTRKLCMALTASLNLQVDGLKAASDSEEDEDEDEDEDEEEEDY